MIKTYNIKVDSFSTTNKGGHTHQPIRQPEPDFEAMLDKMAVFQSEFKKDLELHHKELLPPIGDDEAKSQKWHCNVIQRNNKDRSGKPHNAIYLADLLRHNHLVEDTVKTLDTKKYSDDIILEHINKYWIGYTITNKPKDKYTPNFWNIANF